MITKDFIIENKTGLHARPASKFVQVANEFKSDIFIEKGNTRVNAKSIMGVMTLGAGRGSKIRLIVDGKMCIRDRRKALSHHCRR